jgi:hypothetical protein
LIQARHSTGDSSIPRKPTYDEYLANQAPTSEHKRLRKTTSFFAKETSNIEEVRSSLIFRRINKRSIHDDIISNALEVFNGDVQQAVEALYQNFQHSNPIMSSSSLSSPTNAGKSIFGIEDNEACKAEEESDDTGGSIIDSGDDLSFEDEEGDDGEYSNGDDLSFEDEEGDDGEYSNGDDLSFEDEEGDDGEYSNNEDLIEEEEELDEYKGEYKEKEKDGKAEDKSNELSKKVKKGAISGPVSKVLQVIMELNQLVRRRALFVLVIDLLLTILLANFHFTLLFR